MSEVSIRPLRAQQDVTALARIHCSAFPNSALTAFGTAPLERYYAWQLAQSRQLIGIVAERQGEVIGFCLGGGVYGSAVSYFRNHAGLLAAQVVRRPWLLLDPRFRRVLPYSARVLKKALRPKKEKERSVALGAVSFGVQAIAVDPRYNGQGAGKALLEACEDVARRRGFENIYLAVDTENTNAIRFYERLGWVRVTKGTFWNGHMKKCVAADVNTRDYA